MSPKSVSQIFKILFQTGDINIFVLFDVFFSRYVQLKSSFPDKKCGRVLRQNSVTGRSWSSVKLFMMQNYTDSANGDVPLTVGNL